MTRDRVVQTVARLLKETYHDPRHFNKSNPFDELVFILCSLRTAEAQYIESYRRVKKQYPKFEQLAKASPVRLASAIGPAGLGKQKSKCIIDIAKEIKRRLGRVSLSLLRTMGDSACEQFLVSLPRVGVKTARCVMMYSLGRKVFPVDVHCWRICTRLGWIIDKTSDGQPREKEMDQLQSIIPPDLRYSLHVNMIALGREICTAGVPACRKCPIKKSCKRVGV